MEVVNNRHIVLAIPKQKVNKVIINAEIAKAEFEGKNVEGFMSLLGCPRCNRDTMKYAEDRKPAR
jgi:hypothetical protein